MALLANPSWVRAAHGRRQGMGMGMGMEMGSKDRSHRWPGVQSWLNVPCLSFFS